MSLSILAIRGPFLLAWLICAIGLLSGVLAVIVWRLMIVLLVLHTLGRL